MSVDEGWNDKTVIKQHIKTEFRHPLPYKCLYPCLYCEECEADCYICAYDDKYIDAHSKNKGLYDTEFINIFSRLVCHGRHSLNHDMKGKKMKETPELLICVFPVDTASYNNDAIVVIKPKKDRLVVLMCVESHYTVCEIILPPLPSSPATATALDDDAVMGVAASGRGLQRRRRRRQGGRRPAHHCHDKYLPPPHGIFLHHLHLLLPGPLHC